MAVNFRHKKAGDLHKKEHTRREDHSTASRRTFRFGSSRRGGEKDTLAASKGTVIEVGNETVLLLGRLNSSEGMMSLVDSGSPRKIGSSRK